MKLRCKTCGHVAQDYRGMVPHLKKAHGLLAPKNVTEAVKKKIVGYAQGKTARTPTPTPEYQVQELVIPCEIHVPIVLGRVWIEQIRVIQKG